MPVYLLANTPARSQLLRGGSHRGCAPPFPRRRTLAALRHLSWRRRYARCQVLLQRDVDAPPVDSPPPHAHPPQQGGIPNPNASHTHLQGALHNICHRLRRLGEERDLEPWQVHLGEVLALDAGNKDGVSPGEEDLMALGLYVLLARLGGWTMEESDAVEAVWRAGGFAFATDSDCFGDWMWNGFLKNGILGVEMHWQESQHWQDVLGRRASSEGVRQVQDLMAAAGTTPKDWLLLAPQLVGTSSLDPSLVVEALGNFLCGWEMLREGEGEGEGGFPEPQAAMERFEEVKREAGEVRASYLGALRAAAWLQDQAEVQARRPSPPKPVPSPSHRRQEFFQEMHALVEGLHGIGALSAATSALTHQLVTLMEKQRGQPGKAGNLVTALLMLVRQWERHRQAEAAAVVTAAAAATAAEAEGDPSAFSAPAATTAAAAGVAGAAAVPPPLSWKQAMAAVRAVGGSANEKSSMERYQQCVKMWQQSAAWQELLGEPLSKQEQRPGRKAPVEYPPAPVATAGKAQQQDVPQQGSHRIRRLASGWASPPLLPLHQGGAPLDPPSPDAEAFAQWTERRNAHSACQGSTAVPPHAIALPEVGGRVPAPSAACNDTMARLEAVFYQVAENEAAAEDPSSPLQHPSEPMLVPGDVPLLLQLAGSLGEMSCAEGTLAASLIVILGRARLRRRLSRTAVAAAVAAAGGGQVSTCLKSGTQQMEQVWQADPSWQQLLGPPQDPPSWVKGRVGVLLQRLHQQGLLPPSQPLPHALALAADLDYTEVSIRATGCLAGALAVLLAEVRGEHVRMGEVLEGVRVAGESATLGAMQSYVRKCREHWEGSEVWRELLGSPNGRQQTIINPPLDHLLRHLASTGRLQEGQLPLALSLAEALELKPRSRGNYCVGLLAVLEDGARGRARGGGPRPFWHELVREVAAAGARVNNDSAQRFHKKVVACWKEDRRWDALFGRPYDYD